MAGCRALPSLLAALLLAAGPAGAEGVLVVKSRSHPAYDRALAAFKLALPGPTTEAVVGTTAAERAALADQAIARSPQLIFALGNLAAKLMLDALPEVPLVYCLVERPEEAGLTPARATGVSLEVPVAAQLELVRRALPAAVKVGVVYTRRQAAREIEEAKRVAPGLGLTLVPEEVLGTGDVRAALGRLAGVDVLWVVPDTTVLHGDAFSLLLEHSFAKKIPLVVFNEDLVARGALLALSVDPARSGELAAGLAAALVAGKPLAQVPPVPPATVVVVNRSTMKRFELALPVSVLTGAVLKD